ncbi:hypothetical protein TSOC_003230 [Tetrabaena socialis]|uniref:Uncharacterized protein n=1 Tax=Tetrabaena socialis TaxID=47790 RepID=A0A2J8AC34_9CHLO|nr:hypothetical protein TSOC_003230 [Tetrabaena socialis]|eukprot:PNH10057.1 hypothetical protein TSOC_003230 [Tetrabaena socialis]
MTFFVFLHSDVDRECANETLHEQLGIASRAPTAVKPAAGVPSRAGIAVSLAASLAAAFSLTAFSARAEEAVSELNQFDVNEATAATLDTLNSASSTELIVAVLFGIVVFLLAILTGGVAYINIKQFLDSREESEDREKRLRELKIVNESEASSAKPKGATDADGEVIVSLRRASRVKKAEGKGFSAADLSSRR